MIDRQVTLEIRASDTTWRSCQSEQTIHISRVCSETAHTEEGNDGTCGNVVVVVVVF